MGKSFDCCQVLLQTPSKRNPDNVPGFSQKKNFIQKLQKIENKLDSLLLDKLLNISYCF